MRVLCIRCGETFEAEILPGVGVGNHLCDDKIDDEPSTGEDAQ